MDKITKGVFIFLSLFALPFAAAGLFAVSTGMQRIAAGGPKEAYPLVLGGLVFSLVGFGLLAGVFFGTKKMKVLTRLSAENPASPWMWRADWAQGRANSKTQSTLVTAWTFAVVWNLISAPILFLVPREQFQRDPKTLVAFLFPAVGIGLLVWAVRETLAWLEFGKTCMDLATVPAVIGRELRGNIQARFPRPPEHGIRLKLSCVNRIVSGSGNNHSTSEKILFRDERAVSPSELCPGPMGITIPVAFRIPLDARPTDTNNPRNSISWLVEADADVPGVDYKDVFEVPVFRTKDTPSEEEAAKFAAPEPVHQRPASSQIVVTPTGEGAEFYFPAGRNRQFAASTSLFLMIWCGAIGFMVWIKAPLIFAIVSGLFGVLLLYISLDLWLGSSRVVIGMGKVSVRMGMRGSGRVRQIAFSEIARIQSALTAQQGGSTGTPYYDIQLVRKDGKKIALGKTLRDKQEVEWLLDEMSRLAGLNAAKAAAASAN